VKRKAIYPHALVYGELIRHLRQGKGITLKDLADLSRLSYQYLSNVERGEVNTPIETLVTIFAALEMPLPAIESIREATMGRPTDDTDPLSPHHHVNSWELARLCASLSLPLALGLPL
jgi:transcriptional regulator with XRE-family HTH domain